MKLILSRIIIIFHLSHAVFCGGSRISQTVWALTPERGAPTYCLAKVLPKIA